MWDNKFSRLEFLLEAVVEWQEKGKEWG